MSGYYGCACRDCMEIVIGSDEEPALCDECEEAGCAAMPAEAECRRNDAYGQWEDIPAGGEFR